MRYFAGKHRENVGPFIGMHGEILIRFVSDDTMVGAGFAATWDSEPYPKTQPGKDFYKTVPWSI